MRETDTGVQFDSLDELRVYADRVTDAMCGCGFETALRRLKAGEWRGTIIANEISGLLFLMGRECELPHAETE